MCAYLDMHLPYLGMPVPPIILFLFLGWRTSQLVSSLDIRMPWISGQETHHRSTCKKKKNRKSNNINNNISIINNNNNIINYSNNINNNKNTNRKFYFILSLLLSYLEVFGIIQKSKLTCI